MFRFNTLDKKNKDLHKTQDRMVLELDERSKELTKYQKQMETEKITINNKLTMQQQQIEKIENEKSIMMGERSE